MLPLDFTTRHNIFYSVVLLPLTFWIAKGESSNLCVPLDPNACHKVKQRSHLKTEPLCGNNGIDGGPNHIQYPSITEQQYFHLFFFLFLLSIDAPLSLCRLKFRISHHLHSNQPHTTTNVILFYCCRASYPICNLHIDLVSSLIHFISSDTHSSSNKQGEYYKP